MYSTDTSASRITDQVYGLPKKAVQSKTTFPSFSPMIPPSEIARIVERAAGISSPVAP
ncbi:hypothetical protein D3C76_1503930 [compost metagenome]